MHLGRTGNERIGEVDHPSLLLRPHTEYGSLVGLRISDGNDQIAILGQQLPYFFFQCSTTFPLG